MYPVVNVLLPQTVEGSSLEAEYVERPSVVQTGHYLRRILLDSGESYINPRVRSHSERPSRLCTTGGLRRFESASRQIVDESVFSPYFRFCCALLLVSQAWQ